MGRYRSRAVRDLVVVAVVALVSFWFFMLTNAADRVHAWLGRVFATNQDEVVLGFGLSTLAFGLLAVLRWRDSTRHLVARLAAEERYREVVEKIPAVTYTWDPSKPPDASRVLYVSPQVEPILGFSVEEWIADPDLWKRQIHPDDREAVLEASEHADRTGEPFVAEYRHLRPDGTVVWIHEEAVAVAGAEHGAPVVQGVMYDITDRKRAEVRLREAEERYRALVEQLPAITYVESADGRTVYISPQIETVLGFTPEEWMADRTLWARQLHPDDRERTLAADAEPYEPGRTFKVDYRIYAKDGRVVWLHNEAVPVLGEDGQPIAWQGVVMDITERKIAEEALTAAETRFRTLVEQIPAVTYIHGPKSGQKLVYISPQIETMLGYTPDEWGADLGIFWRRMHPDDVERVRAEDERTDITGEPFHVEYRMFTKDGRLVWIRDDAVLVRDADGVPSFWQGVRFDVTAQKQSEAQLREAEERYRAIVEHIPAAIYVDLPDGSMRTVYASPQIQDIVGITAQEWVEDPNVWLEIMHPDDRPEIERSYVAAIRAGEPWRGEYRVMHRDGRWVWVHDETALVRDEEGRPLFLQGVLFDITERKQAEEALRSNERREREAAERLRALDEMKNTFLAAVSHELRSPLTSILGLALTLQQQEIAREERGDLLERLAANARKLDRLLSDLLDIDRLNRGIVTPQCRPVELGDLVRRTVENLEAVEARRVVIEVVEVVVLADAPKVERIVENLVVNALRHTGESASVWVRVRPEDGGGVIVVEDDGPGVPAELRREIFAPFRQGPTASPHSPGTGIGLSLVSMFAELHGGRAWVQERDGGGASFRVFLPSEPPAGGGVDDRDAQPDGVAV